uniref:Uncharacterized protein n=1 Tax=viral metagenome TaxID=1070528 RepID=A0A6M3XYE3_9ZZZZ
MSSEIRQCHFCLQYIPIDAYRNHIRECCANEEKEIINFLQMSKETEFHRILLRCPTCGQEFYSVKETKTLCPSCKNTYGEEIDVR